MSFEAVFNQYRKETESFLESVLARPLPEPCYFKELPESVKYSLTAGGKRLRPVMLIASCVMAGGTVEEALPFAAAMEMIHTSSLIHDDLPAMDDDDLRRGRPTNHKVFGEATAILAGDALLVLPFEIMAEATKSEKQAKAMKIIAQNAGICGMFGGQQIDLNYEGKKGSEEVIVQLNRLKTGALFRAAVCAGIVLGGGGEKELEAGIEFGEKIGLAFQLVDDLLDNDPEANTGKTKGSDIESDKSTYLSVYGEEKCREMIKACTEQGEKVLKDAFGDKAEFLIDLAKQMEIRKN
ncbi:MAG: polyprenyl synthetase family protein [Clostridia bacterium]|nr:polyprenyl synthetase family protein [Clostridia bacterium]